MSFRRPLLPEHQTARHEIKCVLEAGQAANSLKVLIAPRRSVDHKALEQLFRDHYHVTEFEIKTRG